MRFKFTNKLSCNLCISLTIKFNSLKILLFNLWMSTDNSIMYNINSFWIIIMWVSISLYFFTTSCPSCMSNTNMWFCDLFWNLLHYSLNAISFLLGLLSPFNHCSVDFSFTLSECNDSSTIISSIFEKLYS